MSDPMLSENADDYREDVLEKVRATIEEDRAARREQKPTRDTPATLVGGTGALNSLIQSV